MIRHLVPVASLLSVVGCGPQNATLTEGSFTAFMATSALTISKGTLDLESDQWDSSFKVDCREFVSASGPAETAALRLPGHLDICKDDEWPPIHESWLTLEGFHVVEDTLDPWRGEAIMTSEGDFQVGFHHRLPGGGDFRFSFTIDPNFQPMVCEQTESGDGTQLVNLDGDWVGNWSGDVDSGRLFYLNAGAYQFSPEDVRNAQDDINLWPLPPQWLAGTGDAKFGDDFLLQRPTYYAQPRAYSSYDPLTGGYDVIGEDLFYCEDIVGPDCAGTVDEADITADETLAEWEFLGLGQTPRPLVHSNDWRESDGLEPGIDDWVELNYSWVILDEGSVIEVGGSASGEFNILLEAYDTHSHVLVSGRFEVDRIKDDIWTTDYLPDIKQAENNTVLCGESEAASEE